MVDILLGDLGKSTIFTLSHLRGSNPSSKATPSHLLQSLGTYIAKPLML
jgi:hypothetical protein